MSFNSRSNFLTETTTIADVQQLVASMTLAKIARPVTVKIHNASGGGGSGVIINRNGATYTVLTANRAVGRTNVEHTIHTHQRKEYAVTRVIGFQKWANVPDIAIVQFDSSDTYPVASLGNSDHARIGTPVYMAAYPLIIRGERREFDFSKGMIRNRLGGLLLCNAPRWRGVTGAPVFNTNGQVIGIRVAREVDRESGTVLHVAVFLNRARCRRLLETAIAL